MYAFGKTFRILVMFKCKYVYVDLQADIRIISIWKGEVNIKVICIYIFSLSSLILPHRCKSNRLKYVKKCEIKSYKKLIILNIINLDSKR